MLQAMPLRDLQRADVAPVGEHHDRIHASEATGTTRLEDRLEV